MTEFDFLKFAGVALLGGFAGVIFGVSVEGSLFKWLTVRRQLDHEERMERFKLEAERERNLFESTRWTVPREKP